MRLQITPPTVVCPHQVMAPITKSLSAAYSSIKEKKRDQFLVRQFVLSSPFKIKKFLKSPTLDKGDSGIHRIKRSCSASLDEEFAEYHVEEFAQSWGLSDDEESRDYLINKGCCGTSETEPYPSKDKDPMISKNFFWQSQIDLLEPKMLGIRPEPPDWPERESVIWADIEQKAKSFDLPLSLKMIQKKHQREGSFKDMGELAYSSVKKAFSSMVFIIVELQSYGLHMREALCDENLELIISKVQKDMLSSFVWLFQHVFSRTPALMIHIMILLANFSVHSTSHHLATAQASLLVSLCETAEEITSLQQHSQIDNLSMASLTSSDNNRSGREVDLEASRADIGNGDSNYLAMSSKHLNAHPEEFLQVGNQEFRSVTEVSLWNSFLDEATKLQAGPNEPVLDHTVLQKFVSPISVELEPDDYIEYLRTDLKYQMGLSQEPNNTLLLSNYAQFLHLVARDYDRAEECFKQAIQVEIPDAESHSLYADFLWTVRKDLWRAEDAYLQALSIEPENPYYASKYASFLWNTGGEETCFPLDASNIDSNS